MEHLAAFFTTVECDGFHDLRITADSNMHNSFYFSIKKLKMYGSIVK